MPVLTDTISHSVKDSLSTFFVGEEAHGSSPSPNLSEITLQHIGGAYLLPQLLREGIVMETVVQVLLHTFDLAPTTLKTSTSIEVEPYSTSGTHPHRLICDADRIAEPRLLDHLLRGIS